MKSALPPDRHLTPEEEDDLAFSLTEEIVLVCRRAGLSRSEALEVASDIWAWILRSERSRDMSRSFLTAVVRFHIARRRQEERTRTRRETSLDLVDSLTTRPPADWLNSAMLLNELERRLPPSERAAVRLFRQGFSWSEAFTRMGIPAGSHSRLKRRILRHARSSLGVQHAEA